VSTPRTAVPLLRRLAVGAAGLLGVVPLILDEWDEAAIWIPVVFLAAAAVAVHVPRLGVQLLARAAWWSGLGLGTILCTLGSRRESVQGLFLSLGCGVALLGAGQGLREATERAGFAASTSRSGLLLLMVLCLADAQTFALMGTVQWGRSGPSGPVMFGLAALWVVAFVGMVRLAGWATLLAAATSVLALVTVGSQLVRVDGDFLPVVWALCSVQLLCAVPVLSGALRGRPLFPPVPARARAVAAAIAIALLMLVAVLRVAEVFERLG
jgi:hypothetical protein